MPIDLHFYYREFSFEKLVHLIELFEIIGIKMENGYSMHKGLFIIILALYKLNSKVNNIGLIVGLINLLLLFIKEKKGKVYIPLGGKK